MKQPAPTALLFVLLVGLVGQELLVAMQLPNVSVARLLRGLHLAVLGLNLLAVLRNCGRSLPRRLIVVSPVVLDVMALQVATCCLLSPVPWLVAVLAVTGVMAFMMTRAARCLPPVDDC